MTGVAVAIGGGIVGGRITFGTPIGGGTVDGRGCASGPVVGGGTTAVGVVAVCWRGIGGGPVLAGVAGGVAGGREPGGGRDAPVDTAGKGTRP